MRPAPDGRSRAVTAYLAVLFDVDETLYDRTRAQPLILRNIMAQLPELFAGQAEEEVFAAPFARLCVERTRS